LDAQSAQTPLKVCRRCSVATRTDADTCPNCGRTYQRELWRWRWWFAIPIVAAAFAAGYFGISRLIDNDEGAGVTAEQAAAIEPGSSQADVEDQLGEAPQYERDQPAREGGATCAYYALTDQSDAVWEFCFHDDKLVTSRQLGAEAEGGVAAPPTAP
jgi:hypothetical protein